MLRARVVDTRRTPEPGERPNRGIDHVTEACRRPGPARTIPGLGERVRCRFEHIGGVWIELQEFAQGFVGIEPDHVRIRAEIRLAEDPAGPVRDVVALEPVEQRELDLGLLGDGCQSNLALFAPLPQSGAETFRHGAHLNGPHTSNDPSCWKLRIVPVSFAAREGLSPLDLWRGGPRAVRAHKRFSRVAIGPSIVNYQLPTIPTPKGIGFEWIPSGSSLDLLVVDIGKLKSRLVNRDRQCRSSELAAGVGRPAADDGLADRERRSGTGQAVGRAHAILLVARGGRERRRGTGFRTAATVTSAEVVTTGRGSRPVGRDAIRAVAVRALVHVEAPDVAVP